MPKSKVSFFTNSNYSNLPDFVSIRKLSELEKKTLEKQLTFSISCKKNKFNFKPCLDFFSKPIYEISRIYEFENTESDYILSFSQLQKKLNGKHWTYKCL